MIPVEFLINRMGLLIRLDDLGTHLILKMKYPNKDRLLHFSIDKKTLEMMQMQGYFAYDKEKIGPLEHYAIDMMLKIEPGLNNLPIDFKGLKKYLVI